MHGPSRCAHEWPRLIHRSVDLGDFRGNNGYETWRGQPVAELF